MVGGKPIYHVLMYPYLSERDYLTVVGKKPQGAAVARGKGSAFRTIRRLTGQAPGRIVKLDMGIQDVAIIPKGRGVGIRFTPDQKQETTGDITIGKRLPILDRPTFRLSKKGPRITPKTPRLRR